MKLCNVDWISVKKDTIPLEEFILVAHKYGVEYVSFNMAAWRYCYSGEKVDIQTIKNITHWCKPLNPQNFK